MVRARSVATSAPPWERRRAPIMMTLVSRRPAQANHANFGELTAWAPELCLVALVDDGPFLRCPTVWAAPAAHTKRNTSRGGAAGKGMAKPSRSQPHRD